MIKLADKWLTYKIIASGNGQKLEKWGDHVLLRPDPQAIWDAPFDLASFEELSAKYIREGGGGHWQFLKPVPTQWTIDYLGTRFLLKPSGFKHTGLFPEQAVNWDTMKMLIEQRTQKSEVKVLNLFAYTGAASVVCAKANAKVTHVDAAKGMVERAGENARLNDIGSIRYIVDDCKKFIMREIRRGNKYDAIIMDPPSYGRGPDGEIWKLEDNLFDFVKLTAQLLNEKPLFFLINSYTTGLAPSVLSNILTLCLDGFEGDISAYEVAIPTEQKIIMPCGASGLFVKED